MKPHEADIVIAELGMGWQRVPSLPDGTGGEQWWVATNSFHAVANFHPSTSYDQLHEAEMREMRGGKA